jgi:ADP-heptose:LPS heptosyltransferase
MIDSERPVVLFGNGLGDHLLALPTLRALSELFDGRLALISMPGMADIFLRGLRFRSVCETAMRSEINGRDFDVAAVAQAMPMADLMISLNPWHSPAIDRLLTQWSAPQSLGFSRKFSVALPLDYSKHSVDLAFGVARHLDPRLEVETFAAPPLASPVAAGHVGRILQWFPPAMKILAVHADTGLWTSDGAKAFGVSKSSTPILGNKMWPLDCFVGLLDAFLDRHPDYLAIVVGGMDMKLDRGAHKNRVISACGLPIDASFAFVGVADLFVGVDSCMLHAADLHRVPSVGLFGPTNPREFGLRFCDHVHVARADMHSISVDEVCAALDSLAMITPAAARRLRTPSV